MTNGDGRFVCDRGGERVDRTVYCTYVDADGHRTRGYLCDKCRALWAVAPASEGAR